MTTKFKINEEVIFYNKHNNFFVKARVIGIEQHSYEKPIYELSYGDIISSSSNSENNLFKIIKINDKEIKEINKIIKKKSENRDKNIEKIEREFKEKINIISERKPCKQTKSPRFEIDEEVIFYDEDNKFFEARIKSVRITKGTMCYNQIEKEYEIFVYDGDCNMGMLNLFKKEEFLYKIKPKEEKNKKYIEKLNKQISIYSQKKDNEEKKFRREIKELVKKYNNKKEK